MPGTVTSLQRCPGHREPMEFLEVARFDDEGIEGDEHRSPESIRQVLLMPAVTDDEVRTWFG